LSVDAVLADVLRLGLIGLANDGRGVGRDFYVDAHLERAGSHLVLESRPGKSRAGRSGAPVLSNDDVRRLRRVVWDHRAVDVFVPYRFTSSHWLSIGIGNDGHYEFKALASLASHTSAVGAALNDVLKQEQAPPSSLGRRVVFHPVFHTRLIGRVALTGLQLPRRVVLGYLKDPVVAPRALARDLLRFAALTRLVRQRDEESGVLILYDGESSTLTVQTSQRAQRAYALLLNDALIRNLRWQNDGASSNGLPAPNVPAAPAARTDDQGVYTFHALGALAHQYPREMSSFFRSLTEVSRV
jgi:hypothetical protein